jgi:hypothetical protein
MYIVAFVNVGDGIFRDTATWTEFKTEGIFRAWYTEKKQVCYRVLGEGVTLERARALCSEQNKRREARSHEVHQH